MNVLQFIEFGAVISSAAFGLLLAAQKRMDFVGLFSVASAVAFAGGTLRDLFLDRHPLFWVDNWHYVVVVFFLAVLGSCLPSLIEKSERWLAIPDALGMGLFTVVGTNFALQAGTSAVIASMLGVITGTFGGVVGDVICNRIPSLFRPTPLNATCAFLGSWAYMGAAWLGVGATVALSVGIAVVVASRLASLHWNLRLPAVTRKRRPVSP